MRRLAPNSDKVTAPQLLPAYPDFGHKDPSTNSHLLTLQGARRIGRYQSHGSYRLERALITRDRITLARGASQTPLAWGRREC